MLRSLIKILLALNVLVFLACLLFYIQAQHTDPTNGWNGLLFIWFYYCAGISVIIVAVAAFMNAIIRALGDNPPSKTTSAPAAASSTWRYKPLFLGVCAMLIPVPLLYFAYMADDRMGLRLLGWAAVAMASISVAYALYQLPPRK